MILYGLKNCDTCRKALKLLPEAKLHDVRATPMGADVLAAAYARFGDSLLNTRSTTWRGLTPEERSDAPLSLLQAHPTLMKRPLIAHQDKMYLGWTQDVQAALTGGDAA